MERGVEKDEKEEDVEEGGVGKAVQPSTGPIEGTEDDEEEQREETESLHLLGEVRIWCIQADKHAILLPSTLHSTKEQKASSSG